MKSLTLLKFAVAALAFAGTFLLASWVASAPMPSGIRTGVRGLVRQRALEQGGAWCQIEPLVRWIGKNIHGLLSPQLLARLDRQVCMAGSYMGLLAEEVVALSLLCTIAGLAAGTLANVIVKLGPAFVVGMGAFGAFAPSLTISSTGADRAKAIGRRLPSAIDLLALCMSAGLDFPSALRQVVEKSGIPNDPLVEELGIVLQSLQLGRTRRQALEEFRDRAPGGAVAEFVNSVVQAELRGNPLSEVLQIQGEISRRRRTELAEEAAAKASVKIILPLVLVFVAILILVAGPMVLRFSQMGM